MLMKSECKESLCYTHHNILLTFCRYSGDHRIEQLAKEKETRIFLL